MIPNPRSGNPAAAAAALAAAAAVFALLAGCVDPALKARYRYVEQSLDAGALAARMQQADALYREPRSPETVKRSLEVSAASISRENGYAALWRAARACAWLAESELPEEDRERIAFEGVAIAREAVGRNPQRAESHFYYALTLGLLSQIQGRGWDRLPVMEEEARKVVELDEKYEHAGGHRFLGLLYLSIKDIPLMDIGDIDDAYRHLQRACELFPDYGHNQLSLAEAYYEDEEYEKASACLRKVLGSSAPPDESAEHQKWLKKAAELMQSIKEEES